VRENDSRERIWTSAIPKRQPLAPPAASSVNREIDLLFQSMVAHYSARPHVHSNGHASGNGNDRGNGSLHK